MPPINPLLPCKQSVCAIQRTFHAVKWTVSASQRTSSALNWTVSASKRTLSAARRKASLSSAPCHSKYEIQITRHLPTKTDAHSEYLDSIESFPVFRGVFPWKNERHTAFFRLRSDQHTGSEKDSSVLTTYWYEPLHHRDDFSRPALRHESLISPLYLPS